MSLSPMPKNLKQHGNCMTGLIVDMIKHSVVCSSDHCS